MSSGRSTVCTVEAVMKMSGESGDQEMNQDDRRKYLIEGLLKEQPEYENMQIPSDAGKQKILLRSLMNIRMPKKMDYAFCRFRMRTFRKK